MNPHLPSTTMTLGTLRWIINLNTKVSGFIFFLTEVLLNLQIENLKCYPPFVALYVNVAHKNFRRFELHPVFMFSMLHSDIRSII